MRVDSKPTDKSSQISLQTKEGTSKVVRQLKTVWAKLRVTEEDVANTDKLREYIKEFRGF